MIYYQDSWEWLKKDLRGYKIILISGFFDCIHGGHIDNITTALEMFEGTDTKILVVVNGNSAAKRKKGYVILPIKHRLKVIDSIKGVDYVIDIDEDSVEKVIEEFRPHYFFKSGDRQINNLNIKEVEMANQVGCKIIIHANSGKIGSSSQFFYDAVEQLRQLEKKNGL